MTQGSIGLFFCAMLRRMKKYLFFALLTINVYASPISFNGNLGRDCSFVDSAEVLDTVDSLLTSLNELDQAQAGCESIHQNTNVYLSSIQEEFNYRNTQYYSLLSSREVLLSEISRLVQAGSYNGEYDIELLALEQQLLSYEQKSYTRKDSLNNTFALGSSLFQELSMNTQCLQNYSSYTIKPTLHLLGQAVGAAVPGSSLVTSGIVSSLANYIGDFIQFSKRKKVANNIRDILNSNNYHSSLKCAYKNLNSLSCDLRRDAGDKTTLKEILGRLKSLDLENNEFKKLRELEIHFPRIQSILTELRDIYETSQQKETSAQIAAIDLEISKLKIRRPNPFLITEWTDREERITQWNNWSKAFEFFMNFSAYYSPLCSQFMINELGRSDTSCEPNSIIGNGMRTKFLQTVVKPALKSFNDSKLLLAQKLRESSNPERLFNRIQEEENNRMSHGLNISKMPLSKLLNSIDESIRNNPISGVALFERRILLVTRTVRAMLEFDSINLNAFTISEYNESCDLDLDEFKCDSFYDLAQAAYLHLSNKLGGSSVLPLEEMTSTYFNYLEGNKSYYLNNKDITIAKRFNEYQYLIPIYNQIREGLKSKDGKGSANLPLLNDTRLAFEDMFKDRIQEKLEESVILALAEGKNSDYTRDALHSCAIFYPMLDKLKQRKSYSLRKGSAPIFRFKGGVKKECDKLFKTYEGLALLRDSDEQVSFDNVTNQCFYSNYEEKVLLEKVKVHDELEEEFPEL